MNGIIYKITNTVNNQIYIGQTILNLQTRWLSHCSGAYNHNIIHKMVILKAILKYGKENFKIEVLEKCDYSTLDDREIYYINKFDSYYNGYNSTLGGLKSRRRDYFNLEEQKVIIELYLMGFSLRLLGKEFQVAKQTIKLVLSKNNIKLYFTRSYKFSLLLRRLILLDYLTGMTRKEIIKKWKLSKSYLSQLINELRRI